VAPHAQMLCLPEVLVGGGSRLNLPA